MLPAPDRFALGGAPFTVHILISDKYNVGSVYNFVSRPPTLGPNTGCENCRQQQESKALQKGQVIITNALIKAIHDESEELESLERDNVEKYLQDKLRWVVKKVIKPCDAMFGFPGLSINSLNFCSLIARSSHSSPSRRSRFPSLEAPVCTTTMTTTVLAIPDTRSSETSRTVVPVVLATMTRTRFVIRKVSLLSCYTMAV